MQIVYFSGKSQFLTEIQQVPGEKKFITPSPAKADGLRSSLLETSNSDVVTIAKFTGDLVKQLWSPDQMPEIKRKADLLLIFGILKNKYFPDLGYEQFIQAYNLFSDLRSFTLNEDALNSVLEEQSPEIKRAVELFWRLLDVTGYLDEHGAYQKISEALRSSEEIAELKKSYIFWGFQHLNGQQVDLLKALSIRYNVIVPFPLVLKNQLKRSDWPTWLRDSKVTERDLPELKQSPKGKWVKANSREISLNLRHLLQEGDQVVLGISKLSPLHLDFLPSKQVSFKIPHQLIGAELNQLSDEIKSHFKEAKDLGELEIFLENKKRQTIKDISSNSAYKMLKALELYSEVLESIHELTDEVPKVDRFFLKLLREVVSLNQPRTSYVPVSPKELTIDLKDMSSLEDIKGDRRVLLCLDDRFEEIQGLGQNYTESIQKALSSLGPLKRSELELLFKQWEFHDLFSRSEATVLMSDSILKHSLIWKRLFAGIELEVIESKIESPEKKLVDELKSFASKKFQSSFSASKFQTFIDCPRKFYFNYVEKLSPRVTLENDFDSLVSGTIIHKIIEEFHKRKLEIEQLSELTEEIMQFHIRERKLTLSRDTYLKHELIFNQRAQNGIMFLRQVEDLMGGAITWQMEVDFSFDEDYKINGKIDCLGKKDDVTFLLDFKSTKFSASSNKEIEDLESVQLWAYAIAASKSIKNFEHSSVVMGFVSLDNPADSNLLFSEKDLADKFKAGKFCRQHAFKLPYPELFNSAKERMTKLSQEIKEEILFPARPRKDSTCMFCELNKICIKSELKDE